VLEYCPGIKINDAAALDAKGLDRAASGPPGSRELPAADPVSAGTWPATEAAAY